MSSGDDPTGSYCTYRINVQSAAPSGGLFPLPDYPRIGQDRQAVYLASNLFSTPTAYKWEELLILSKAQLYACQTLSITTFSNLQFGGVQTDTTQPANDFSPMDDPRSAYFVTSRNFFFGGGGCSTPCNGLIVWTVNNPLSSPTMTAVSVATTNNYSQPPNASQAGSAHSVDAGDVRISGMVMYAAGSLYASVNTAGSGGEPGCILYQIQPLISSSTGQIASARMLNEIVLAGGSTSWFYCTQQPDPEGNVTTVFNTSSTSSFVSLAYASRRAAQPTGTLPDGGIIAIAGAGLYNQGRWGDYTAVAPAGLIVGVGTTGGFPSMWFAGMYARSDHTWGTGIAKNLYSSPTQP